MSIAETKLVTVEEYAKLPNNGRPTELVRGRVVEMNLPKFRHGKICSKVDRIYGYFADENDLGHMVTNDTGIITERNPDTLRGADVAFYSYQRLPKGKGPKGYPSVTPNVVFEVLSPDDRWSKVLEKVAEYLNAGVDVAYVLDPESETVHIYRPDAPEVKLTGDDELILPEFSTELQVKISSFFN